MRWVQWIGNNLSYIGELTTIHLYYTLLPTAIGIVLSIPLGYLAFKYRRSYTFIVGGTSLFYTIPSLALFILLPSFLGTRILDPVNVIVALVIYTVALLVRVVADGLKAISPETIAVAKGMGYSGMQTFFKVELPIAVPTIISGLRVVLVSNISIVTVAAIVGIVQLGSLFTMGFTRRLLLPIIVGLVVCTLLAIILDRLLLLIGRWLTPWSRREGL